MSDCQSDRDIHASYVHGARDKSYEGDGIAVDRDEREMLLSSITFVNVQSRTSAVPQRLTRKAFGEVASLGSSHRRRVLHVQILDILSLPSEWTPALDNRRSS